VEGVGSMMIVLYGIPLSSCMFILLSRGMGKHETLTLGSHNLHDRCAQILDDFPPATHDEECQ